MRHVLLATLLAVGIPLSAAAQPAPQTNSPQTASPQTNSPDQPLRVGGVIRPPTKTHNVAPIYPPQAQADRIEGTVIVQLTIGTRGTVEDARVVKSIPALDGAALDAVRQWQFTPTVLNGIPQTVLYTVTVSFQLEGSSQVDQLLKRLQPGQMILTMMPAGSRVDMFAITPARARELPAWDPQKGIEPPISLTQAVEIAKEWLRTRNAGTEYDLLRVMLAPGSPVLDANHPWFYSLQFLKHSPTGSASVTFNADSVTSVVVLLDRSVVEPQSGPMPAMPPFAPPSTGPDRN